MIIFWKSKGRVREWIDNLLPPACRKTPTNLVSLHPSLHWGPNSVISTGGKMKNCKRDRQISLRCSEEEHQLIMEKIHASGKTNTDFLLDTLKGKEIIVYNDLKECLAELKQEGINLNQAMRYAHVEREFVPQLKIAILNCNALYLKYLTRWRETYRM